MKPYLKNIVIPAASAILGGIAVVAALKLSPELRSKLEGPTSNKQTESREQIYDNIIEEQKGIRRHFDNLFDDDFFGQSDPFAEMKKMREEMEKRMEEFGGRPRSMSNPFDSWFTDKFGGGSVSDISKREDDKYVYYDIRVDDVKTTSINTKVENGYVTITGTQEKKTGSTDEDDNSHSASESYFKSTFNRTFPIPENVDANKMEMLPEKDKIVLKFPKLEA